MTVFAVAWRGGEPGDDCSAVALLAERSLIMPLAIRHRRDVFTPLPALPGFAARQETSADVMARLQARDIAGMQARMAEGHRAWVASIDGEDAAWGWVATRHARIGELDLSFAVPTGERYLWNFVTLAAHRGRGVYPRLLDAIVRSEAEDAERFWIIWAPENRASGAGIGKAGFVPVAELSFEAAGRPATSGAQADAAARLLAVHRAYGSLAPCWRCARAGRPWMIFCAPGACSCDYQRPDSACRAS